MNQNIDEEVIRLILQKAYEKLKTAEIDFQNKRYDDSISRSYYAVFHCVSAALFSKGLHFSTHSQVIGKFNREFVKNGIFPIHLQKLFSVCLKRDKLEIMTLNQRFREMMRKRISKMPLK